VPRACLLIRPDIRARWQAFQAGLSRSGFAVQTELSNPTADDVLVIWNRHRLAGQARQFEAVGARVIVSENGWLNAADGTKRIALQLGHHNGVGKWHEGPEDRWSELGIELKPWRADGSHLLVLAQRGIGEPGVAQPRGWVESIVSQLRSRTDRRVLVRAHPGNHEPPLEPDWSQCWAAVTWASGAGIKAVVAGVPVFYGLNKWIGASAALPVAADIEQPFLGDRLPMLQRLAWAQWSLSEITTGEPFARLLGEMHRPRRSASAVEAA
jgi:hypothetical protein